MKTVFKDVIQKKGVVVMLNPDHIVSMHIWRESWYVTMSAVAEGNSDVYELDMPTGDAFRVWLHVRGYLV